MAEFTEHYHLKKPEDAEYYDVADFNGNMDIIDAALAGNTGGAEAADKIGEPADAVPETVFGKLNGYISKDGKGVRTVKSVQRVIYRVPIEQGSRKVNISPVDINRCLVLYRRYYDIGFGNANSEYINYTLNKDYVSFSHSTYVTSPKTTIELWIVEFY